MSPAACEIMNTVFPRVVPTGTIDFNYWIDATSIRGRPLFEGGFYFFSFMWKFRPPRIQVCMDFSKWRRVVCHTRGQ